MRPAAALRALALLILALALPGAAAAQANAGATTARLQIRDDAENNEMVLELGPVDLPAGMGHLQLPALHGRIPVDAYLHGFRVEMVDGQGREVPSRTLHHVNVISGDRRELFSQIMLRVAAAGQETEPAMLPRLMGYRVQPGQRLIVTAMFHNPFEQAYQGARLRVHFPYTPGNALLKPLAAFPFYMDVMPPAGLHSYDLPPGRSSKSWEARPAVSGRILGVGGHLHKYGVALRLEDATDGKVLWEGRPTLDEDGEIAGMPTTKFLWSLGVPVRADHVYRVTADYVNPTGEMIPGGAMGALGGVFIPSRDARWPGIDTQHPELRRDWWFVHNGNQDGGMMGGHGGGHGGHQHGAAPAAAKPAAAPAHSHGADGHAHGTATTAPAARKPAGTPR
jgi:hypothetical protein